MTGRAVLLLGVVTAGIAAVLAAQGPMPITVKVKPRMALPGTPIVFTGTTVADGKRFDVHITVVTPSQQSVAGSTRVDAQGNYTVTFNEAKAPGVYRVTLTAPDGQGHDTTSFAVGAPGEFSDEASTAVQHIVDDGVEIEQHLEETVADLPESPAKEQLKEKMKGMQDSLHVSAQRVQQFHQAMQKLGDVQTRYPETAPVFHDMYVHLGDEIFRTQAEADARKFEILRELDNSRAAGAVCDRLEATSEGFKAVSAAFNLAGSLMGIVRGYLTDYVAAKLPQLPNPALQNNPAGQLALGEAIKGSTALLVSPTGWVAFLFSLGMDIAAYYTDKEFAKYCERFEGPFTATMHGEVFRGSETWWTMDIRLEGRLTLRYPKAKQGEAIHLTGQFEGAATDYREWDDALPVLFPKLMRGTRTFKKTIVPVGLPYYDVEGRYAALASPTAFMVPVEGDLIGRKLTLRLQPAKKDIPETYRTAHAIVAVMSPLALMPVVVTYPLPYQSGEFVLKHGLELDDGQDLVLEITIGSNSMQVQREWQHDKPGDGVKAHYTGSLRLCNPSCQ